MLTFDDFRKKAKEKNLKSHQKVGRGDIHVGRDNAEKNIFPDIQNKLNIQPGTIVCDIGCGCSVPALALIDFCRTNNNRLILIDSPEMLEQLPDAENIEKLGFEFPRDPAFLEQYRQKLDYIICYSVVQIPFVHGNMFDFVDKAVSLLKSGGKMLIGDLPNVTKKKRFLSTKSGIKFHQEWSGSRDVPKIDWTALEPEVMDEGVIFALLHRYRNMGCETYLLPQSDGLPMNKTREDILIVRW